MVSVGRLTPTKRTKWWPHICAAGGYYLDGSCVVRTYLVAFGWWMQVKEIVVPPFDYMAVVARNNAMPDVVVSARDPMAAALYRDGYE